ncbi:IS982 family transposase [Spirulina major]|uniref:IS982 family transposase n=1 Tax=Spirulina major TaxID=270636 RepID=UPI000932A27C|nr:IS982 family transposase [Spirulina major]
MIETIVALYCVIDDILTAIGHQEDSRRRISDTEVILTALVAARFFAGNHQQSRDYLDEHGLIPAMLSASRLNRRLHLVSELMYELQMQLGQIWMELNTQSQYRLDSFPVPVCDNIRIRRSRLFGDEEYRGYVASKKCYFYGLRIHLVSTIDGVPVEWVFLPGSANDVRGLRTLPLNLPSGSELYVDKGYTDYVAEDNLARADGIKLMPLRKKNSQRADSPCLAYIKQTLRHPIETTFSQLVARFPKRIHAVTAAGFLLKVSSFIWMHSLESTFL